MKISNCQKSATLCLLLAILCHSVFSISLAQTATGPPRTNDLQAALNDPTVDPVGAAPGTPNILFIIMDDVGIDQLAAFNPQSKVSTPNLDTLIHHGVSFNNC